MQSTINGNKSIGKCHVTQPYKCMIGFKQKNATTEENKWIVDGVLPIATSKKLTSYYQ